MRCPKDTKKRMWKYINAIYEINCQNGKKQKWRHQMDLLILQEYRATKDNNEEPSKPEIFIVTRTKMGKEILVDTQVTIVELQNCQNYGKTADDAFRAVFEKEQPSQLRCYGRSMTTSSLKKDEEINNLKQKHANEITSLKEALRKEMRHLFTQLRAQAVKGTNLPHSSGLAHDSVLHK
ncbi:hypothetical protein H5410_052878, partial [Solanum commersonii]